MSLKIWDFWHPLPCPFFTLSVTVLILLIRLHSCRHNHNTRRKYCEGLLLVFTMILGPITGDGINSAVKGYHELLLCLSQAATRTDASQTRWRSFQLGQRRQALMNLEEVKTYKMGKKHPDPGDGRCWVTTTQHSPTLGSNYPPLCLEMAAEATMAPWPPLTAAITNT